MTDLRDLCARMADELDRYRQHLMDDRSEVHALAAEARAALAKPEPEGPTDDELNALWNCCGIADEYGHHEGNFFDFARAVLARWGRPEQAPQPISLDERLPGPEDCYFHPGGTIGCCWWWNPPTYAGSIGWWSFEPWEWIENATHWLPAHALPMPRHD